VSWNATGTHAHRCAAFYEVNASLFGGLFDNTTGSWVAGANASPFATTSLIDYASPGVNMRCTTATPNPWTAAATNESLYVNLTVPLVPGHQYFFYTGMNTSLYASQWICSPLGGPLCGNGVSYAAFLIGGSGKGAWLTSIRIT
jgi:hypothetical protein